jgi:drug/metabolite transporter (DMT)-like permease
MYEGLRPYTQRRPLRRGPAYVSVYRYAAPALAGIGSFFLFGDSLRSGQLAGAGIVFAGMPLARWGA